MVPYLNLCLFPFSHYILDFNLFLSKQLLNRNNHVNIDYILEKYDPTYRKAPHHELSFELRKQLRDNTMALNEFCGYDPRKAEIAAPTVKRFR